MWDGGVLNVVTVSGPGVGITGDAKVSLHSRAIPLLQ